MSRRAGAIFWGAMVLGAGLLWAQPAGAQAPGKSLERGVKFYKAIQLFKMVR